MAIWRDLVDDHGFPAQYASVRRFVVTLRGPRVAQAHPVIVTAPGEEGQVDYGDGPMVRHPVTRKYRRTRLFVFTLGYSRKSVRLLTFQSSTRRWAELHEETFRRLGGATRVVVLDNLREGVLSPDIYDPTLNPLYRDVLAHYGAVALPCRVGDPDRKGKVESAIDHTQGALKGLRFERLDEAHAYLDRWDARWADTRIHGTTKRKVAAMFAEERPALRPLPVEPFRYYQFGTRTVHLGRSSSGHRSSPRPWAPHLPSPAVLTRRSRWSRAPSRSSAVARITSGRHSIFCARGRPTSPRIDEAASHAREALALTRRLRARASEAHALCLAGDVASTGGAEDAEGYYRDALALAGELGMRPLVAHCHLGLGARASGKKRSITSPPADRRVEHAALVRAA